MFTNPSLSDLVRFRHVLFNAIDYICNRTKIFFNFIKKCLFYLIYCFINFNSEVITMRTLRSFYNEFIEAKKTSNINKIKTESNVLAHNTQSIVHSSENQTKKTIYVSPIDPTYKKRKGCCGR